MWPSGIRRLQLRAAGLVLCILCASWLNVMIPRQLGIVIDSPDAVSAWVSLCVLILLVLGASDSGLGLLKRWLWIPLRAFSNQSLITSAYSHILHLSADFHDSNSTPQTSHVLISANAFSSLVETALLEAIPALLDLMIAAVYLSISLESLQGLIIAVVGFTHFYLASHFMAKSADRSRRRKEALCNEISIRHQGLAVWHDSDAIGQLGHEDNRHADAVAARQIADASCRRFWIVSTAVRVAVLISGGGASTMLAMYQLWKEQSTLGDYMMLVAYWTRLHQTLIPLVYHGTHMGDGLTDAENFIQLMRTVSTMKDRGNARPLKFSKGEVEFDNVCFEYSPGTPIIKNFSLRIPTGQTVAFIESQNADTSAGRHCTGKSTLMKLLRRSYDVTKGSIRIDGQDIRDVHLHSLRQRISLVLPFPVLLDDTIMNNVRYGRITATDEEVYEACKAACIHQKIQGFPGGYNTQVGENGTKLSSSEIQLIGIARAILKIPESGILILDGATSALDEDTESRLQSSISVFCKNLTKLMVTNRVATAMKADLIVVMADGQILEQGTPEHLFRSGSKHAAPLSIHEPVHSNVGGDDGPTNNLGANVGSMVNDSVAVTSSRAAEAVQQAQDASASKEVRAIPAGQVYRLMTMQKSKLNPVAPTFTPRGTRITVRTEYGSSSSEATNSESQPRLASSHTSCQWSDEVTAEEERLKSACKPELTDHAPATASSLSRSNWVDVSSAAAPRTPCGQVHIKPGAVGKPGKCGFSLIGRH
jgi:ABC-type multidrug transport system fused ATPase/permease subunit